MKKKESAPLKSKIKLHNNVKKAIKWQQPPADVLNLNVDAVADALKCRIVVGSVVLNNMGEVVVAVGLAFRNVTNVETAEAKAILIGILMATGQGFAPILCGI
ncbi:hypothetical protein ACOSP7_010000 [Xanthoceras sorbifolium]